MGDGATDESVRTDAAVGTAQAGTGAAYADWTASPWLGSDGWPFLRLMFEVEDDAPTAPWTVNARMEALERRVGYLTQTVLHGAPSQQIERVSATVERITPAIARIERALTDARTARIAQTVAVVGTHAPTVARPNPLTHPLTEAEASAVYQRPRDDVLQGVRDLFQPRRRWWQRLTSRSAPGEA